jgi:hypothetical protein
MLPEERVTLLEQGLAEARRTISPHYDDVFREVQQRLSATDGAGKADIAMLSFWKRLRADTRWVPRLLRLPDFEVREVTGPAVVAARKGDPINAGDAREMLRSLPGFGQGTALASALLTAASPTRLAVYDKRARKGLQRVELELADKPPRFFYTRYMLLIEQCRAEAADEGHQWSARDVDLALYILGGK